MQTPAVVSPRARKVLLVGWDGADWQLLSSLIDQGKLPHVKRLVERGVAGSIMTLQPPLSPMLWTSIATGKRPYKHGILGFSEPTPDGTAVRPISNVSRRTHAIWNILQLAGKKSNVLGWWPSHPAEPISGVMVSDMFHKIAGALDKPWPLAPGAVHPARLADDLAQYRIHPQELTDAHIGPFVPEFGRVDQDKDHRLEMLAKIIAECSSVHAAATAVMQLEPWDFMAVYYDSIDHFSHAFMAYHPPRLPWIPEEDFALYQGVVEAGYRFHDMLLGTLLQLAGADTTVMLVSDHGFHANHLRPASLPMEPAGPAVAHSDHGVLLLHGPGIKRDERLYGASLLDITPTILHLFGLPIGADMDGAVLVNAFDDGGHVAVIPSWDDVAGACGRHPADLQRDPGEASEALQRLVELGYVEPLPANARDAVAATLRELRYNEARAYMNAGIYATAAALLAELWAAWPNEHRFATTLISCQLVLGDAATAATTLATMTARKTAHAAVAKKELEEFNAAHKDTPREDWSEQDHRKLSKLQNDATTNQSALQVMRGMICAARQDWPAAVAAYDEAIRLGADYHAYVRAALVLHTLKDHEKAEKYLLRAHKINPDDADVLLGLCRVHLGTRRYRAAADEALQAVGLDFQSPMAHYYLAVALARCGNAPRAIEALLAATRLNPNFSAALDLLAQLYEKRLKNPEEARHYRARAEAARAAMHAVRHAAPAAIPDPLTAQSFTSDMDVLDDLAADVTPPTPREETVLIVSGLPRAGTSLMMQMLDAGGVPVLTDAHRAPDDSNPRGYFEYAPVKNTRKDASWVAQARGTAVKVIAQLLPALPRGPQWHYRVIFMERDLKEILDSQQTMLGQPAGDSPIVNAKLFTTFSKQLLQVKRFLKAAKIPTLYVGYHDCINDPARVARTVSDFIGGVGDPDAMARVVDAALWHARGHAPAPRPDSSAAQENPPAP